MNIVFLGPPGSGKGTQAKRLADSRNLLHMSTGDMFREAIQGQTEMGKEIKSFVDSGKLVPDELVSRVVFEYIEKQKGVEGFLLDGYPRTVDQAKALDIFSEEKKVPMDVVLFFDVDAAALVKRLSARRSCPKCKEVYNLETRPPKVSNKCDLDSVELIQRPDDKAEVVQDRLRVYELQTAPILDHYKGRAGYHRINAAQDIDRVFAEVISALQSHESQVR